MNLWGRITQLKSYIKPGLIALIPVFLGCEAAEDAGTEFDLETNVDVNLIEFDLTSTNVYLDSLRTDGENRIFVGSFDDDLTGNFTSESYFQFKFLRGFRPGDTDTLKYDSVIVSFETAEMLPIAGPAAIEIDVFELQDTLISNIIYLASRQEQTGDHIADFDKMVRASEDTAIAIKLSDTYGTKIFEQMSAVPDSINLLTEFFQGIALVPGPASEALMSFNMAGDTSKLRIYMSDTATSSRQYFAEFDYVTSSHSYITRDRSATEFSSIVEKQDFDLSDGRTVVDPIAGITTTFNFDVLEQFFEDNPRILLNSAILDLQNDVFFLRDTLAGFHMHFREPNGGIFGPGIIIRPFSHLVMNDEAYLTADASPAGIVFNRDTRQFIAAPTLFFQALYNNYQNTGELIYIEPFQGDTIRVKELVMVNPTEMTLARTVFNDSGIKLRLFYTEVNQ